MRASATSPQKSEQTFVCANLDPAHLAALESIEQTMPEVGPRRRSAALRRAITIAAETLRRRGK